MTPEARRSQGQIKIVVFSLHSCSVRRLPFRPTSLEVFYNTFAKSQLFCIFFAFFRKNRVIVSLSKYIDDLDSVFLQESAGNSSAIAGGRILSQYGFADAVLLAYCERFLSPEHEFFGAFCPGDMTPLSLIFAGLKHAPAPPLDRSPGTRKPAQKFRAGHDKGAIAYQLSGC